MRNRRASDFAKLALKAGIRSIPYAKGVKGPTTKGWPDLRYESEAEIDGVFPEVEVVDGNDRIYRPDSQGKASITGDELGLRMMLPLRSDDGQRATAHVLAKLTVQTVWFWTVTVEGAEPKTIRPHRMADGFKIRTRTKSLPMRCSTSSPSRARQRCAQRQGGHLLKRSGENTVLGSDLTAMASWALATDRNAFAASILPAQPLNSSASARMVHYIRYRGADRALAAGAQLSGVPDER
jgi:hypothetical protein